MNFDQTLQALGSAAILGALGESVTGKPARYEPEFEQMQAEIDKLIALEGGATDWALVSECASTLLAKKSKDLLCAAYLCAALRETRGWSGLAEGLNVIKALVTTHWDALHPERLRARKTAADWLLDRIKPLAESTDAQASDKDALTAAITLLDELVAFGETRWEGDPPTFWSLTKILKEKLNAMSASKSESAVEATLSEVARPTTTTSSVTSFTSSSAGGVVDRQAIYRQILALAEQLIANEPHSPVPYLLRRAAAWGPMALPQLYAELQRSGSMWDLVLQQLPEGFATLPAAGSTTSSSSLSSLAPTSASTPAPASPRPRGDY